MKVQVGAPFDLAFKGATGCANVERLMTHARLALWITALSTFVSSAAHAQQVPEAVYLNSGALQGSHKMVALGGAYTGIAEGIDGYPSNLTVLAHRAPNNRLNIDFGVTLGLLDTPFWILTRQPETRDLDNDGVSDRANSLQFQAGAMFQYKGAGVGGFFRSRYVSHCENAACVDRVSLLLTTYSGGFAFSLGHDNVLLGAGITGVSVGMFHRGGTNAFGGLGVQVDALLRPQFIPIRIGGSIKSQLTAGFIGDKANPPSVSEGRGRVSRIIIPAIYSIGASFKLGEGAEHYNRLSVNYLADLRRELGEEKAPKPISEETPTGRVLVTLQLDIIGATQAAVPLAFYGDQQYSAIPVVGTNTMYQPRGGVEIEPIRKRLRIRGGTYLEPSPFPDQGTRLHGTGGFELLMFHLVDDWSLTGSIDYARLYYNFGLSIGFWR